MDQASVAAFALQPFRALRLTDSHVGDPTAARVISRPYRSVPGRLLEWRRRRHLQIDPEPSIYLHEYTSAGVTVRGLVGLIDLAQVRHSVFAHEGTYAPQVNQLADRMSAMSLNPAPILLMHAGEPELRAILDTTAARPPDLVYTDRSDQVQRIWRITSPTLLSELNARLSGTQTVIADGHHRYQAAQQLAQRCPGTDWASTLVMLVDQHDTPLQLSAIHRTVPRLTLDAVRAALKPGQSFVSQPNSHAALAHLDHALVLHDGTNWATLESKNGHDLLVRWLHEELIPAWGAGEAKIAFHHSAGEAISRVGHGVTVLLPAPRFTQVAASATSGLLLPAKATSFQPKPNLGVLMRQLDVD
ncbi:DUF1015 family protein [Nocardioides sp. Bht2]|uniref:DUF1015 family protein n=1 Tax=Nocardioides sp. Bht2 TaxID=3392297 RepID=UPI0039B3AE8E